MVHYKLSPNEEARILKEEREKRRKLRLQQVREQAKVNAAKLRESVRHRKEELIETVAENLEKEWDLKQQEKLYKLKAAYEQSLQGLGESHQKALDENPEWQQECRELLELQEKDRAAERHQVAIQRQRQEMEDRQQEDRKRIMTRLMALDIEKSRAQKIASLPKPKPDPVDNIELIKLRPVKFTDRDAFATSRYHIPETVVEKENYQQQADAKYLAAAEDEKYKDVEDEKKRVQHERAERARLRHKAAVEKELLKHDYKKLLNDLSDLQRADVNRRRQALEKLPKQIFLAPHRRLEEKEERQLNMERAFEDVYMTATDFAGDLSLALDPHPVVPSATQSLDVTTENQLCEEEIEESFSRTGTIPKETTGVMSNHEPLLPPKQCPGHEEGRSPSPEQMEQKTTFHVPSQQGEKSVNARSLSNLCSGRTNNSNLRKVFDKIKAQREEWIRQSVQESPERDAGRDTESIGTEPKSLSQYTASSTSGDSPVQSVHPLPCRLSGSTYSISGGTLTSTSDGGADFNTPPAAEASDVRQRYSSSSSGQPSVTDSGSLLSDASRVTPSSAGSRIAYECNFTSLDHPDMLKMGHQPTSLPSKDLNSRLNSWNGQEDAVKQKIELQQREFERQRKEYEERLKMLDEKKRHLELEQHLSKSSDFNRDETSQWQKCLLADLEQNRKTQPNDTIDSTAFTGKSNEHGNSATIWATTTHVKAREPFYSNDTVRSLTSDLQPSCDRPGSLFGTGSLSNDGSWSGTGSLLAGGLGLSMEQVKRYQEELLRRQANQQTAIVLARKQLQLRTQQLFEKSASRLSSQTLNTSSSSSSNREGQHPGSYGNELSTILETSERLELSAHPKRLDRYVSPSEVHSDSVLQDFLEDSSLRSSLSTHQNHANTSSTYQPEGICSEKHPMHKQPYVAYEDHLVRSACGRTHDIGLGESVSTNMSHQVSLKHWEESSLKPTPTNESLESDQLSKSGASLPAVHQVCPEYDFSAVTLNKTQKSFLGSFSSTENLENSKTTRRDGEAEGNFPQTFSKRSLVLNTSFSSETSTGPWEAQNREGSFRSVRLQAMTQTHPSEQKNWSFQSELSQKSVKHDDPPSPSQYTVSTESRSWESHLGNNHSPISADQRAILADLDYGGIDNNLGGHQMCLGNKSFERVVEDGLLIDRLNVEGRMIVDHYSSFKDQRSNASCRDQEFSLQHKKVEHCDVLSQDMRPSSDALGMSNGGGTAEEVPVSMQPKQGMMEGQTGSSGAKSYAVESNGEDDFASHGLISYSGNVFQEWRPLVPDKSPTISALKLSQQMECSLNTEAQDVLQGINGGALSELVISGKGTFQEPTAAVTLNNLDLGREEPTYKDESVRAGYWSFQGLQGVHAFHTAPSGMQFTDHDPLQDNETTFPTAFEESQLNEPERGTSEELPQFPLPNMQSTLLYEDGNGTAEMSTPHVQNPDLSQHFFSGSLNSRLSSEAGHVLHFTRDSNDIRSIPPCSREPMLNRSEKLVPLEKPPTESVNSRSSESKQYQPEFFSLVAHTNSDYRNHKLLGDNAMCNFYTNGNFPLQDDPIHSSKTVSSINNKSCDADVGKQDVVGLSHEQGRMSMNEETNRSVCRRSKWGEIFETYRSKSTISMEGVPYDVSKYETKTQMSDQSKQGDDEPQLTLKISSKEEKDVDRTIIEGSSHPHSFDIPSAEPGILDEPDLTLVNASSTTLSSYGTFSQASSPVHKNPESSSLLSFERHELSAANTSLSSRSARFTKHSEQKQLPAWAQNESSCGQENNISATSDKFPHQFLSLTEASKTDDNHHGPRNQSKNKEPVSKTDDWLNSSGNSESGPDHVSLQAAFLARKKDFVEKSLQRVVEAKEKAKASQMDSRHLANQKCLTKTVSSYIKSRAVHGKQGSQLGHDPGNINETSSEGRKLAEKEMKNRTARLYSQLEEVKLKKEEEDRKTFYAQNREKRRDYEKKHIESKKKKASKR